ncbi:MAG: hypothetical protein BWK80_31915 [Desulfobacteraceae bacterium IS3]|nr:MAG: hypothetical protein BWK80_31915 [Desulfobacteraceae bacterium IS3]
MIKKMIAILMVMGMILSGIVFADEITKGKPQGTRPPCPNGAFLPGPPKGHPADLGKYLHDNMLVEALSEITGQSAETIKTALETQHPEAVMETYGVDFEAFRTLMDGKTVAMAEKAAECGLITQEQAAEIAEKIAARAAASETSN